VAGSIAAKKPLGGNCVGTLRQLVCGFPTLEKTASAAYRRCVMTSGVTSMKKLALGMAAVLALLSIAGCAQYYGKGKAPPPVVTTG
jgi:hypothetical protein